MIMEKILKIEDNYSFEEKDGYYSSDYSGYRITTDKQEILIGIENHQSCCETWGYMSSEDDLESFVGSTLLSLVEVDEGFNSKVIEEIDGLYEGAAAFFNFNTDKGTLQFALYNAHNGYYSHGYMLKSNQLNESGSL